MEWGQSGMEWGWSDAEWGRSGLVSRPDWVCMHANISYTVEPLLKDTPEIRTPLYKDTA